MTNPNRDPRRTRIGGFTTDASAVSSAIHSSQNLSDTLTRLDLVRGVDGEYKVAEIEVDKYHGLGYTTVGRVFSGEEDGVGTGLIPHYARHRDVSICLGPSEKFYEPEASYFCNEVGRAGGNTDLLVIPGNKGRTITGNIFALPIIRNRSVNAAVSALVDSGDLRVLSKQGRYLTSKHALSIIRNVQEDKTLEELLVQCVGSKSLNYLRGHIPYTCSLVDISRQKVDELVGAIEAGKEFLVKGVDSSGAKGIITPDDRTKQVETILGRSTRKGVVVQEMIETQPSCFDTLDLDGKDDSGYYNTRYGLFVTGDGKLLDLGLTSSKGTLAHGGPNSILNTYVR